MARCGPFPSTGKVRLGSRSALLHIASKQLQIVTRFQARAVGVSDHQLQRSVRTGDFQRLHPGIFLAARSEPTIEQRAYAACVAGGSGSFASHITAGHLWELVEHAHPAIDITVPVQRRRRLHGVAVHRSTAVGPPHRGLHGLVPIASPTRTLVDLSNVLSRDELELVVDDALRRGMVPPAHVVTYLDRADTVGLPGRTRLREVIEERCLNGLPESHLESLALLVFRRFGLPEPARQHRVRLNGRDVRFDLAYPDLKVAIELDGRAPHTTRERWQTDHDRHNATERSAWIVLRFTWWDVTDRPLYIALTVGDALGIRPTRWTKPKGR